MCESGREARTHSDSFSPNGARSVHSYLVKGLRLRVEGVWVWHPCTPGTLQQNYACGPTVVLKGGRFIMGEVAVWVTSGVGFPYLVVC